MVEKRSRIYPFFRVAESERRHEDAQRGFSLKREQEITRLDNQVGEDEQEEGIEDDRFNDKETRPREQQRHDTRNESEPKALPIMLSIPEANGNVILKNIGELPSNIQTELRHRFDEMCSAQQDRVKGYRRVQKNPEEHSTMPLCVRDTILRHRTSSSHGCLFREKGRTNADDRCIKARDPSTYMILHKKVPALCMVPLPEERRGGRNWTELAYRIRE